MFKKKFQSKNISEIITCGDCLRRRREENNLSLLDVSKKLGIKHEYLENLESGNYKELPPQVYVRGFIKRYADLLGIDGGQLIKIYNREVSFFSEEESSSRQEKAGKVKLQDYLVITPKLLTFIASLFVLSVFGYYFLHQLNSFNSKPYLFLASPVADEVVQEKDLLVSGKTEGDAILKINGQDISVNGDGNFSQKIALSAGRNALVIEAKNRFNKTERKEINIVYNQPQENNTITEIPASDNPANSGADAVASDTLLKDKNVPGDATGVVAGVKDVVADKSAATRSEATAATGKDVAVSMPAKSNPAAVIDPDAAPAQDKTGDTVPLQDSQTVN